MNVDGAALDWVVLTRGDRPQELSAALASLATDTSAAGRVIIVANGGPELTPTLDRQAVVRSDENLGVPGGRHLGIESANAEVVGFLDDDAEVVGEIGRTIVEAFEHDAGLGAVALRIIDENGETARRHVPRLGAAEPMVGGDVAVFLGGACAVRRAAYNEIGGYFTDLFYGHEELELSWRLVDAGWSIRYLPELTVRHPRLEISRHADGWRLTGRNRVWVARRTLPWPVAVVHVTLWLALGLVRAPDWAMRRSYLAGWFAGWRGAIDRAPIRWATVVELTRLGRPPVL